MRKRKSDRRNQFIEVQEQIQEISNEIYGSTEYMSSKMVVDDGDLSLRKLEELHRKLHELQKEKVELFFFHSILIPISANFAAYYLNAQCSLLTGT